MEDGETWSLSYSTELSDLLDPTSNEALKRNGSLQRNRDPHPRWREMVLSKLRWSLDRRDPTAQQSNFKSVFLNPLLSVAYEKRPKGPSSTSKVDLIFAPVSHLLLKVADGGARLLLKVADEDVMRLLAF